MQLLPGIADADLAAVGPAIGEIQREVGDYFAPAQQGRFTSPAVSAVLAWLEGEGITGVGQSSWGPTGFAILPDADTAATLCREAQARFGRRHASLRFMVTRGRNRGAEIRPG
jgi:predicted sugar kinase